MKSFMSSLIGLLLSVSVSAESLLEGRVRLASGAPAAGVQVRLFDLADLRRSISATTDETGHFTLALQAFAPGSALPQGFALGQNYPNPFNPSTLIPYQIPTAAHVRLEMFNVLGQRVATLVDGEQSAGAHTAQWDATDAAGRAVGAGVYIYRLSSGGATVSRRMVLIDGQAGIPAAGAAGPMPMQASALERVDAAAGVYGLTVVGDGLVAYVNPAFRVGVDAADIVLEVHDSQPRMKRMADGILGDVNNDGQVNAFDALYISLYSRNPSIVMPNNGDISLGDVNGDGAVNGADVSLLLRFISDPSDPSLPAGIGQAVLPVTRTTFESSTPSGYTRVTLSHTGSVGGDPAKFSTDSNVGTVAYMLLGNVKGCSFADTEADRQSKVYVKTETLGQEVFFNSPPETVCRKSKGTLIGYTSGVRLAHLRFFDESSPTNIKEVVFNASTGRYVLGDSEPDDGEGTEAEENVPTNLTRNDATDSDPAWSPDGTQIVMYPQNWTGV